MECQGDKRQNDAGTEKKKSHSGRATYDSIPMKIRACGTKFVDVLWLIIYDYTNMVIYDDISIGREVTYHSMSLKIRLLGN